MDRQLEYVPDVVTFLSRHFGLRCWFDDPGQEVLMLEMDDFSATELLDGLSKYGHAIKNQMVGQHLRRLSIFVGGPCNGQPHQKFINGCPIAVKIGRAKWAAYRIGDDHRRAWFVGFETSMKKAYRLARFGVKRTL